MIEIYFLGVGEACDGNQPNTSILVKTGTGETSGRILLDCGFSVPHQYLSLNPPAEELEILWISHFHGDHFLGTPLLLLWYWEMNRTKPLTIIGPPGVETKVKQAMELAYPKLISRFGFSLLFHEMIPEKQLHISDSIITAAYNEHSEPCLALKLEHHGKAVFYSGDGRPTPMTGSLADGCDIIIHEAYGFEDSVPGHSSIKAGLDFARKAGAKRLALVHMQRNLRKQYVDEIAAFQKKYYDVVITLPEKGDTITV